MKTQTILLKLLRVLAFAGAFSTWAPNLAQADTTGMFGLARNGSAGADVVQKRQRVGPYATWTRAHAVANYYRQVGFPTPQAFPSGDGYYFDRWSDDDIG